MADSWKMISIVLGVLLLVSLFFNLSKSSVTGQVTGRVTGQEASQKAVSVLQTLVQPGTSLNVQNVQTQSGIYNVSLNVNNQVVDVFVTPDGRYLFTNALDLQNPPSAQQPGQQPSANVSNMNLSGLPVEGSPNAPVTIVEFSDFQCPFCGKFFTDTYSQLKKDYIDTGKAKLVFANFPLTQIHDNAENAAEASLCADEQGKFWEMHDKMFQNQNALTVADLKKYATDIGLSASFSQCLDSGKYKAKVAESQQLGLNAGVTGTPTFFVNGQKIEGAQPISAFQQAIGQ